MERIFQVNLFYKLRVLLESFFLYPTLYSGHNEWLPEENLGCPKLIAEFEQCIGTAPSGRQESKRAKSTLNMKGFDRGLVPEKIVGATDSSGELMLLMKWKNLDEADMVLAKTAYIRCPDVVFQFFEKWLTWPSGSNTAAVSA